MQAQPLAARGQSAAAPGTEWQQRSPTSGTAPQRQQRPSGDLQRWMLLPAEFIRWLRQNRYAVVAGAVVTLVLVWLASAAIGRRRYA